MADYISLATSDSSYSKKFKVVMSDYNDGTPVRTESLSKTISGKLSHSIGGIGKEWNVTIRVNMDETLEGYGNTDDLEYFYSLINPVETISDDITFTDHHNDTYTVHMVGNLSKSLLGCELYGDNVSYIYNVRLLRVE